MTSTRDSFLQFIDKLHQDTGDSVNAAFEILSNNKEIAKLFAEQSPKFVEIFSILNSGAGKTETSVGLFQIINVLFEELSKNTDLYFGQLHYLADSIIRRYINDLLAHMARKQAKLAFNVLINSAKVHHTHCRELFRSLDFSNQIFKLQGKPESGARSEYVQLATLFLENPEISPSFMGSKFYLSSIWKGLSKDEPETLRQFLNALMKNLEKTNLSTRCWVFSEQTLVNLAQFPLQKVADNSDPNSLIFDLLEKLVSGPTSILLEDPSRTYCISIPDIDPPPRNLNFLEFVRKLEPFKRDGHREAACMIFSKSPDLISHYFSRITRTITDDLTLANLAAIQFITSAISLPWPDFLAQKTNFFEENRSLNLLFESILPEFVETNKLSSIFHTNKSALVTKAYLVMLIAAVRKFKTLPQFLKTAAAYSKFNARIPQLDPLFNSKSDIVKSFAVKLLLEIDAAIPFYLQDNQSRLPKLLKDVKKQTPIIQLQLIRSASLLQKPVSNLPILGEIVCDEKVVSDIRKEALQQMIKIIKNSGVLDNNEEEAPIWVSFALRNNFVTQLTERVNFVASKPHQFADGGEGSLLCNGAVGSNLEAALPLIAKLHHCDILSLVSERRTVTVKEQQTSLKDLLMTFKWYTVAECVVDMCTIEPSNSLCASVASLVIMCPDLTIPPLMQSKLRDAAFCGNDAVDKLFALAVEISGKIDDDMTVKFLEGTSSNEVIERISKKIDQKFYGPLIGKMLKARIPIRQLVSSDIKYEPKGDVFWNWVFEGFNAVDVDILNLVAPRHLHIIKDETLLADILRSVCLTNKTEIIGKLKIRDTIKEERLLALIGHFYPDYTLPDDSLPVAIVRNAFIADPIAALENCKYEWGFEFLVKQIAQQPFKSEVKRLRHERTAVVLRVFMEDYNEILFNTFNHCLLNFIVRHPDAVTKTPTVVVPLYTEAAKKLMVAESLVAFNNEELKGVCNILNGADVEVPLRVILFLSVSLSDEDSFYSLVEVQNISPDKFMFITGDAARTVIQQIDSDQKITTQNLSRNVAYLQPFHMSHTITIDTPRFRFLMYFANYIIEEKIVGVEHFMECGAISVALRALSSREEYIRGLAYETLSQLYHMNTDNEWPKQSTVRALLESIVNTVNEENQRFCHLATHFMAAFASVLMKPGHNLYMRVVKYITDTPALRVNQIPLFEAVFSKPSVSYRQERNYVLKMLLQGINEEEDIPMLMKNKAIERLMHVFASPLADLAARRQILEILTKVVTLARVDGIIGWAYSIIDESFAAPHIGALVKLCNSTTKRDESDNKTLKMLASSVLMNSDIIESIDIEDRVMLQEIIGEQKEQ